MLFSISFFSLAHFFVDATCSALLFIILQRKLLVFSQFVYLVIFYNILAFALQVPLGWWGDRKKNPSLLAGLGSIMVAGSFLFFKHPWTAVFLAGVGNALFHIGGGIIILRLSQGRATLPGLFVAPGALGLLVGRWMGQNVFKWTFYFIPFLLLLSFFMLVNNFSSFANKESILGGVNKWGRAVFLLLFSIAVRAFIGLSLVFPWKTNPMLLFLLTLAIVFGKLLGGVFGDLWGWKKVALTGLGISAPLLAFGSLIPSSAILGAFCFNLTMPITLSALANLMPQRKGFAFGLTTLALIIGALPVFMPWKPLLNQPILIFIMIIFSLISLVIGLESNQIN